MITVVLNDKTIIKYNSFDEITEYYEIQIIKLYIDSGNVVNLLLKIFKCLRSIKLPIDDGNSINSLSEIFRYSRLIK